MARHGERTHGIRKKPWDPEDRKKKQIRQGREGGGMRVEIITRGSSKGGKERVRVCKSKRKKQNIRGVRVIIVDFIYAVQCNLEMATFLLFFA